ncbi:MAG TPA: universal stress protein [Alphaproteobacteria bacterium]|nr:universal stress protein [Alphaproteobacteria bacterium]
MQTLESTTSISFKNILFLTDLTPASQEAFEYALSLASQHGAQVFPAHVLEPFLPTELDAPVVPELMSQLESQRREQLTSLFKTSKVQSRALISTKPIETQVPEWINRYGIDLVIIGTHGRRGVQRFLLGSTAETIFRTATCPVLTVGPHVICPKGKDLRFQNILFATDLGRASKAALPYALSFAHEQDAHLSLLHVLPESSWGRTDRPQLLDTTKTQLKNLVPNDASLSHPPEVVVETGDAAERILSYSGEYLPDLIVLGLPKEKAFSTHFQTGVTYKVASSAPCAVLTVRSNT